MRGVLTSCETEAPVGPKGPPGAPPTETPRREWTDASVAEECACLETQRDEAAVRGDDAEVRRIEARLRLLGCRIAPRGLRGAPASAAQGAYYLATGIWPILHMRSFERVTGPKTDRWLVCTVGVLVSVIGGTLLAAARRDRETREIELLATGSAIGLAAVETVTALRGRIAPIYLADAALQGVLAAARLVRRARRRRP
jgi:hypothetical protein